MTDRYDDNLVCGYIEGDLSPHERERFERQLAEDAPLRRLVEQLQADRQKLRDLPQESPEASLLDPVHQRLERSMLLEPAAQDVTLPIAHRRAKLTRWLAVSALAAMLIITAGLILQTVFVGLTVPTSRTTITSSSNKQTKTSEAESSTLEQRTDKTARAKSEKKNLTDENTYHTAQANQSAQIPLTDSDTKARSALAQSESPSSADASPSPTIPAVVATAIPSETAKPTPPPTIQEPQKTTPATSQPAQAPLHTPPVQTPTSSPAEKQEHPTTLPDTLPD